MRPQVPRHFLQGEKHPGKDLSIRLDDGVLGVADIESDRPVKGVHRDLHRIAHVVAQPGKGLGVRDLIGGGIPVDHPDQLPFFRDDQIGIAVICQEGRDLLDPFRNVAEIHDAAVWLDII